MSKTEFTPGPWHVDEPVIRGHEGYWVSIACTDGNINKATMKANARLIAAAPVLLSELEEVLSWALVENAPLRDIEIESIREVLAKAKGE